MLVAALCFQTISLMAQRNRVVRPVDNQRRTRLSGHVNPRARAETDLGPVDASAPLRAMTMVFRQSPEQQAELDKLLEAQRDPSSPDYHHWLTPEEYGTRFGVSQDDIDKVRAWLVQQGFNITVVARSRTGISFSGTAAQVEAAFASPLHRYMINGRRHYANTEEPSIPTAFADIVGSIHGLNDFGFQPRAHRQAADVSSNYTSSSGNHYLSPADFATIYNIKPLYDAGYTGVGQKIVVAGQTQIKLSDLQSFRTRFNLPPNDPDQLLIPGSRDPGISSDDEGEADLDLEWSGATAPDAKIIYVYAEDVMDAVSYAIDQNLAPVISLSYGVCELQTSRSSALQLQGWARQANAQGITWVSASGDSGGADCASSTGNGGGLGLAVDLPASIPEVTGTGGTQFVEGSGQYWNASSAANGSSVLSYIPETVWNESDTQGPASGGGGASVVFTKPTWQTGIGIPSDGARDVPDISLNSAAGHDGYLVYNDGSLASFGGTSAAAPTLAGIAALLNQYLMASGKQATAGLGNINPRLYSLAQSAPGVFHDVTTGQNIVDITCTGRARNCTPGSYGYTAGTGYDQATGLGSVDAFALVSAWAGAGASMVTGPPSITSISNAASFQQSFAPGMAVSVFGSNLSPGSVSASSIPLPMQLLNVSVTVNGVAAPLYYVSPGQLNVQIPYEASGVATLVVTNNGQTVSIPLTISAAAPGIFTDSTGSLVPTNAAAPGDVITLYLTGAGAVSPSIANGAAPAAGTAAANLPVPQQPAQVTVGGVSAQIQFIGIPTGLAGITQVNFQVPANAPAGAQQVIVKIGGVASNAATLLVRSF
jgi:uncharacterized protein (TIGR03437 family)